MGISLKKGQTINLEKNQYDLSQVTVGLGWDVRKPGGGGGGFFSKILSSGTPEQEYDLDVVAFLMDQNDKVRNIGNKLIGGDIIFYNSMQHSSGTIWLTGDNRTGAGEGDDEQIIVRLASMSPQVHKIMFVVQIYDGIARGQQFGMVENAFIRAVDAKNREMARFDISTDASFSGKHSIVFAEVYRRGEEWKFRAIGDPKDTEGAKYYDMEKFNVTISLVEWEKTVSSNVK